MHTDTYTTYHRHTHCIYLHTDIICTAHTFTSTHTYYTCFISYVHTHKHVHTTWIHTHHHMHTVTTNHRLVWHTYTPYALYVQPCIHWHTYTSHLYKPHVHTHVYTCTYLYTRHITPVLTWCIFPLLVLPCSHRRIIPALSPARPAPSRGSGNQVCPLSLVIKKEVRTEMPPNHTIECWIHTERNTVQFGLHVCHKWSSSLTGL